MDFPRSSVGKESACSAGDLGSIQDWEDPLEKEMATHSGILAWGNPMEIPWSLADYSPWGCKKADMTQ